MVSMAISLSLAGLFIIKFDVIEAVQDFFKGAVLPQAYTSTTLVLIPKIPKPSSFGDMRPISLCNFTYKIISKILTDRLATILPMLISHEQTGFVKGRLIHENIALAHELAADLDKKTFGGNVIFKVDMAKAYDRMEWEFLIAVMTKFAFSPHWCNLVHACISNCWYTISFLSKLSGYFKSYRGVRQGCCFSPPLYLFLLKRLLPETLICLFPQRKSVLIELLMSTTGYVISYLLMIC